MEKPLPADSSFKLGDAVGIAHMYRPRKAGWESDVRHGQIVRVGVCLAACSLSIMDSALMCSTVEQHCVILIEQVERL